MSPCAIKISLNTFVAGKSVSFKCLGYTATCNYFKVAKYDGRNQDIRENFNFFFFNQKSIGDIQFFISRNQSGHSVFLKHESVRDIQFFCNQKSIRDIQFFVSRNQSGTCPFPRFFLVKSNNAENVSLAKVEYYFLLALPVFRICIH